MARIFAVLNSAVVVGLAVWLAATLYCDVPATDAWAALPPMPTGRNHVAGGAIAGRL